jgi:hypothetical protein
MVAAWVCRRGLIFRREQESYIYERICAEPQPFIPGEMGKVLGKLGGVAAIPTLPLVQNRCLK